VGRSAAGVSASLTHRRQHGTNLSAIAAASFAGRKSVGHDVGPRRRSWSLVSAVGTGYVITTALILMRPVGIWAVR
jgi:hypothetical protein